MGLIRSIRRYLDGKLNPSHVKVVSHFILDTSDLASETSGLDFETSDLAFDHPDLFLGLRTLELATNFFSESNKLGHGGFGPVYKGLMPNGQEIAVKSLSLLSMQGVKEFTNEVKLLFEIRHMNLVTLLGCCVEGHEKMLVYEYVPNRSLDLLLFDKKKAWTMDWTTRFRIVTGVARGLLYLHEEAPMRILHRNIRASNILLDEKLSPKISDFGHAWLFPEEDTHVDASNISGTLDYMAPEYAMYGLLSVKTDVFNYGILLLEIISGRRYLDSGFSPVHAGLLHSAWKLYRAGKTLELVDPSLGNYYNAGEARMCIQLALLCCQQDDADRPDMNTIHVMLLSDSFTLPEPVLPGLLGLT